MSAIGLRASPCAADTGCLFASALHQIRPVNCVRRLAFGEVFHLTVTQALPGDFVNAQLTLCPHSPQISSRTKRSDIRDDTPTDPGYRCAHPGYRQYSDRELM
jgi:hypothetical protein